jgi:hypothetical protein
MHYVDLLPHAPLQLCNYWGYVQVFHINIDNSSNSNNMIAWKTGQWFNDTDLPGQLMFVAIYFLC